MSEILGVAILLMISLVTIPNKNTDEEYPKGTELLKELKKVYIHGENLYTFNMEKIDPYIFREYVYRYEVIGGFSRDVALKKAFEEYLLNLK